jgi:serine phosphatase RsbU (regulator of sigma subunit)
MLKIHTFLAFLFLVSHESRASDGMVLSQKSMQNSYVYLSGWKYHAGDDTTWAQSNYNDESWQVTDSRLLQKDVQQLTWNGIGWFRLHMQISQDLYNEPLGLFLQQTGASEIYVNNVLFYRSPDFAQAIEKSHSIQPIPLPSAGDYLIAVRYKNPSIQKFFRYREETYAGFALHVAPMTRLIAQAESNIDIAKMQIIFTVIPLAIGFIHLIFYIFLPRRLGNLYFSLFALVFAATTFLDYQNNLYSNLGQLSRNICVLQLHRALLALFLLISVKLLYSFFTLRTPVRFWGLAAIVLATGSLATYNPIFDSKYLQLAGLTVVVETGYIILSAIRKRQENIYIMVVGILLFWFFGCYDLLLDLNIIKPIHDINNAYPIGMICLFVCMSIYLARDYSLTHLKLINQERQNRQEELQQRLLQADLERKTHELEEARKLQLAMLPKSIPTVPHLDIAVYIKTATEVGGDYYDFYLDEDGSLTVVVGDATGHGNKAGIMVVLMKSLFNMASQTFYIPDFFNHCTKIIKSMNLGNLYMAMSLLRIKGYKMILSSAGLPPVLVYRQKSGMVEEFLIKGMPLGGYRGFVYQQRKTDLAPGDIILMMSDGYAELFNPAKETLDLDRVRENFQNIAGGASPKKIIAELIKKGDEWRQDYPIQDDITFVVLKVK